MSDSSGLDRFLEAQESIIDDILAELRQGRKTSHWMWFIFPQLKGLGHSSMAQHYGIDGRAEAGSYLAHPVLGPRLTECTAIVNGVEGKSPQEIFGGVDAMKFRSSMTLFAAVAGDDSVFSEALRKYYGGVGDDLTTARLTSSR